MTARIQATRVRVTIEYDLVEAEATPERIMREITAWASEDVGYRRLTDRQAHPQITAEKV